MVRASLRQALQRSRSLVRSRTVRDSAGKVIGHHEWDVRDVTDTIDAYDSTHDPGPVVGERLAALSTGTDLRRAAMEAITLLRGLTDLPEHAALVVHHVLRILDVPEAGDSLPELPTSSPHYGRSTRHPQGVYPPPRDRDDPDDVGNEGVKGWPQTGPASTR